MNSKRIDEAFRKFALVCSGANLEVLKKCPSEESKYIMIGMFIFLTAVFASFSGGYALYKGFKSAWLAALIGLLWGAFIFNVDRFIISTLRRKHIDSDLAPSERLSLWFWEFVKASPRLLLAVLISIVISTPLELKYFEPEINTKIKNRLDSEAVKIRNKSLQDHAEVKELEDESQSLREAITAKEKRRDALRDQSYAEAEGTGGSRRAGPGPIYGVRRVEFEKYEKELQEFRGRSQNKIDEDIKKIADLRAERDKEVDGLINSQSEGLGFLASFEAMNELASSSAPMWWAKVFITFLVLMLECTPIMMKLLASYGPYDSILEADEYTVSIKQRKYISDLNEKTNNELFFNMRKNSAILTVEEQLIQEAMSNMINLVQDEVDKAMSLVAKEVVQDFAAKFTRQARL